MKPSASWPAIIDADYVERLIPALQATIVSETPKSDVNSVDTIIPACDLANVLLMLLATVIEPSSACATSQGMRHLTEAAGKELHALMKDTRRLRIANEVDGGTIN